MSLYKCQLLLALVAACAVQDGPDCEECGGPCGEVACETDGSSTSTSVAGGAGGSGGDSGTSSGDDTLHPSCASLPIGPFDGAFEVPGWNDRAYDVMLPASYNCNAPIPVVVALHGGGHNKEMMQKLTCFSDEPSNEPTDVHAAGCLNGVAVEHGFAVVYPSGTAFNNKDVRTFNAGGGDDGFTCSSGKACAEDIDDVAYFAALFDAIETKFNVDTKRLYLAGASNGGAMSHRLACEMAERIAAIAAAGGGNQFASIATCAPNRPMPVLMIHGTSDPLWPYLGGKGGLDMGVRVAIPAGRVDNGPSTTAGWIERNGCSEVADVEALSDAVSVATYGSCNAGATVSLVSVEGGGHVWPGGWQFKPEVLVGELNQDVNASELIVEFFKQHTL